MLMIIGQSLRVYLSFTFKWLVKVFCQLVKYVAENSIVEGGVCILVGRQTSYAVIIKL